MAMTQTQSYRPPLEILQFHHGHWGEQVIISAVELGLFAPMQYQPKIADAICQAIDADSRGVQLLLDALVGMNLLAKDGESYALTETARVYLLPQSDLYMGDYILMWKEMATMWSTLTDAVKSGKSFAAVNQQAQAEAFFPRLAAAIFPMSFAFSQAAAEVLSDNALPANARVLDLAVGSGVWSIPLALKNPQLEIDALDFPSILEVTRQYMARYGIGNRVRYLPGSWQKVDLPKDQYDLVILGHICHSEGLAETEKLLDKVHTTLKPQGRVMIAEFFANADRTTPLPALLFAINMFLATEQGCVFTETEMRDLLAKAGFTNPHRLHLPDTGPESPVMMATKL